MTNPKADLDEVRRQIQAAETRRAVAEANRDRAKSDLKASLQQAVDKYGVKTVAELETVVEELRGKRDKALADLQEAVRDL